MKSLSNIRPKSAPPQEWVILDAPTPAQIGDELKVMFSALTAGPLPDRMVQLADALEEAFRRGELFDRDSGRPS
ncbi:MAG TPA: hypothetical protein VL358_02430 [Caulobacteraceae bacterium]|jgi:hypothetical protein|nr:hypothetical protein [Caulobacteraceae bacterium]